MTGLRPGTTILRAENSGLSASAQLTVKDGLPKIALSTPSSVAAGARFDVTASATDDVGVARVDFTIEGVPFGSVTTPPYVFSFAAPPNAGGTLHLGRRSRMSRSRQARRPAARRSIGRAPASPSPPEPR